MSEDIKQVARRVLEEIFPADDETALAEVISDDFVNHEAIHRALAEGDTVVLHCTHSGRHTGEFLGLPATGRRFAYKQVHITRVVGGKGVEHWAVRDDAALMRQLTA